MEENGKPLIKKMLIISLWAYPGGGGEAFLYQTMEWAYKLNFKIVYWMSFTKTFTSISFETLEITKGDSGGIMINIPNGFNEKNIRIWTKLLKPDIIHIQGHKKIEILRALQPLRIPVLVGYHFWSGLIELNSETFNSNILENISKHQISNEFNIISSSKFVTPYICSDFMNDIFSKLNNKTLPVIYPSSSNSTYLTGKSVNSENRKYITMCNIHRLKGGELLLKLLKKIRYPFICIQTEPGSEDLDKKIKDIIVYRNQNNFSKDKDKFLNYNKNMKEIYSITKILLVPSIVDETFCRVVNEGMMNGILILTTGAGNIGNMVSNSDLLIPYEKLEIWEKKINMFMTDDSLYKKYCDLLLKRYQLFSEEIALKQFNKLVSESLLNSKDNKVMILAPYCDQGLGIQARNYYNILKKNGYDVYIFSFTPFHTEKTGDARTFQKNSKEWLVDPQKIYYSPNNRENITDMELINFINNNNIGKCLLPETCWKRVFEMAHLLRNMNVKCYAIPNIEIVRKDEIYKYRYFYKVLCNNMLCYNYFNYYGYKNIEYIGYAILPTLPNKPKIYTDKVNFLCLGGLNAFTRKNIKEVCEAFTKLPKSYFTKNSIYEEEKASLTVTVQKYYNGELDNYKSNKNINIITDHLTTEGIQKLYNKADVCIQISKREGLGLGFYESLNYGLPVITLNVPPHNEIIKENYNGWYVKSTYHKMEDNNEALYEESWVDVSDLNSVMKYVIDNHEIIRTMNKNIVTDLQKKYEIFEKKFIELIY